MKKEIVISMQTEMEARPIAELVQLASRFPCQIYLECDEKRVNAKSIMGMMSLMLINGEKVVLDAVGGDEEAAVLALEKFLTE